MLKLRRWQDRFLAFWLVQSFVTLVATSLAAGFTRTAVLVVVVPLIAMLLCTAAPFRSKYSMLIVVAGTLATFATIHLLRWSIDPAWFVGSLPDDLEMVAYGTLTIITIACAGIVCAVFSSTGVLRSGRWVVTGVMVLLLVGLATVARRSVWEPSPSDLLRAIARIEEQQIEDSATMQELSVLLASCGRETEAESVARWAHDGSAGTRSSPRLELSDFAPLPWRDRFTEIANQEQLVIIMEAHNAPKHRQWIEQTLSILRAAGFREYAAEGLAESGRSLKRRGYPVSSTGFYVSDPHFGNLLRTAIKLDFEIHAYEAHGRNYDLREHGQAANLARLFRADPKLKLVVHAGYGHVLKTPQETGVKLMARHLWEMTGIEPYCIWQTWHSPEEGQARQLAELLDAESEPMMLVPVPRGLSDPQFRFPPNAVDAIVLHPPSVGGPGQRVHSFRTERQRLLGVWDGSQWPVLVGAFEIGASADSIALDQVMLRESEREFVLWVPDGDYEIRVFGIDGRIHSANLDGSPIVTVISAPRRRSGG